MTSFRPRSRPERRFDLLPPERARPLAAAQRARQGGDIEDADFIVIGQPLRQPKSRPFPANTTARAENDNPGRPRPAASRVWEPVTTPSQLHAAVQTGEGALRRLSDNMFSALVALVFVAVFAVTGGLAALSGHARTGTGFVPVDITHVSVTPKTMNGIPLLEVNGVIENNGGLTLISPRLRANVFAEGRLLASTLFRTATGPIHTGESRGFQVKLPQAGGKTLEVKVALAD